MADQLTIQADGAYSIDDEQKGYTGHAFEPFLSHKLNPIVKASSSAFFSPRNTIYIGYEGQIRPRTFLNILQRTTKLSSVRHPLLSVIKYAQ